MSMVWDQRTVSPESILGLSVGGKSDFLRDAIAEVHVYGAPDIGDWLRERYGLSRDQTLELALDILTANGVDPLKRSVQPRRGLRRD